MKIHREGHTFLGLLFLGWLVLNTTTYFIFSDYLFWGFLIVTTGFFLFFFQFFRVPEREAPTGENLLISPADGKVVVIEKVHEPEYFQDTRLQVSIFMSPFDVHLNRVPFDGKLVYYKYHKGRYVVAFNPKSSDLNERNTMVIDNGEFGPVLFRQIAGAVARRIKFYHNVGDSLKKGDELGFIKFGSRMDIFLPPDTPLEVKLGDQVFGASTIIARK